MDRLMLLDGNGLIYRGYFALIQQPLTTSKGELVSAVFGFTNIVLRAFQDVGPDHVAVAFDLPKPTFRHERFAEYKATRTRMPDEMREQIPKVRRVVEALGIPVYEMEGYEADDVIATLVGQAEARDIATTILTGDLDMLQLVSERTKLLVSLRGGIANTVEYDLARIDERWGLRPDQMLDYKALKGDPTDNIPGVAGVGEKTAAGLVATHGSVDAMYAAIETVTPEKLRAKLVEAKDVVLESRELMRLVRDLPVTLDEDRTQVGAYDREAVIRLFREYEFRTLIDRLPPLRGEAPDEAVARLRELGTDVGAARAPGARPAAPAPRRPPSGDGLQLSLEFDTPAGGAAADGDRPLVEVPEGDLPAALAAAIEDPRRIEVRAADGLDGIADWLAAQPDLAVSLVASDPRPLHGEPLALAVAGMDGRVVVADTVDAIDTLRGLVIASGKPLVGHDVKAILTDRFAREPRSSALPVAFDTQIAAYVLNASLRSQAIADVVAERLDLQIPPPKDLDPATRAGLDALAIATVAATAGTGDGGRRARSPVRRAGAPAHRGPRPDGGDRGRARPRHARRRSSASSRPRSSDSRPRSSPPSGTSSRSARPSSSARCCSASSSCRSVARPRPGTRRMPRCSRSCGPSTRSSSPCSSGAPTRSCGPRTSRRCRR